ncbi:uncharacterized protein LOC111123183 isoform X1 [Crassostrea virginica]
MKMCVILLVCVFQVMHGLPLFAPNIYQITSRDVREGQNVKLSCTVSVTSSDPDPVTWSWTCGGKDMTVNSTTSGGASTLIFTTNRSHNEQFCYCNAKARNSLNETFDKDSIHKQIHVQYTPLTQPKLNVSGLTLYQGEEATLGCSIDSLGNPAITWSWTCGTQGVYKRLQRNGRTTNVVITAEPTLNGKSCYCTASSYNGFLTVSKSALVTVYYNPPDHPEINNVAIRTSVGSRIHLQCSLSSAGNPPITWFWYCNDVIVTKEVSNRGKTTVLSFVADSADHRKECYCQARGSQSVSGILYDKNSSISFISISGILHAEQTDKECNGISPGAIWATLSILLFALALCLVVIFVQHRRIPKESSLKTWFLLKIGKKSKSCSSSQPSESKFASDDHKYEELGESIQISKIKERYGKKQVDEK